MTKSFLALSLALCLISCGDDDAGGDTGTAMDGAMDADGPDALRDTALPDASEDATPDARDADEDASVDAGDPPSCTDRFLPSQSWPEGAEVELDGALALGQTHIVGVEDSRTAPHLITDRAALVTFTPAEPIDADLIIAAFEGDAELGALEMSSPGALLPLESQLTSVALPAVAPLAFSAQVPWSWVHAGVELRVGYARDGQVAAHRHLLTHLGAPSTFTATRTKLVLYGEDSFDTTTEEASRLARDHLAVLPAAAYRFVDTSDWRLDTFIVPTADGPRPVRSEAEFDATSTSTNHWAILKNTAALRLSLANTGRGLVVLDPGDGDNSPYSFGTSFTLGWYRDTDGSYRDLADIGVAAGWTGWTAMWFASECGNAYAHEIGHSFTLQHFIDGTAERWGVGEEYPADGQFVEAHPAPYDTLRRGARAWYRVNADGPVREDGRLVGTRDAMNGGESRNALSCFPPYTGYHADKIQEYLEGPTLATVDGAPGVYAWEDGAYREAERDPRFQQLVEQEVPVVTLIGTLGNDDSANQIYPAIASASGNLFDFPDPTADDLAPVFNGARYFVRVRYEDGSATDALIASGVITSTELRVFSLQVDGRRQPRSAELWRSATAYPDVDVAGAERVSVRELEIPEAGHAFTLGRARLEASQLRLTARCDPGANCEARSANVSFQTDAPIAFTTDGIEDVIRCADEDTSAELSVEVRDETGRPVTLRLAAQRVVTAGEREIRVPMNDATEWTRAADATQRLRVFAPFAWNADLAPGRYRTPEPLQVTARYASGELVDNVTLHIDLTVLPSAEATLEGEFASDEISAEGSSVYFLALAPTSGAQTRIWWGGGDATELTVPVVDAAGDATFLRIDAYNDNAGSRRSFNAGRSADGSPHRFVLRVATANDHLRSGETYRTLASSPLVIEGRRWHEPDAQRKLSEVAIAITYRAP